VLLKRATFVGRVEYKFDADQIWVNFFSPRGVPLKKMDNNNNKKKKTVEKKKRGNSNNDDDDDDDDEWREDSGGGEKKVGKKAAPKKTKEIYNTGPVTLENYRASDKFVAPSVADIRETVGAFGAAISRAVVTPADCDAAMDGLWSFVEDRTKNVKGAPPVKRDDPSTYVSFFDLIPSHSMLLQHFGIGHAQFAWDLRQNEAVVNTFATIWDTPAVRQSV
jgi:hypothetical protein